MVERKGNELQVGMLGAHFFVEWKLIEVRGKKL